MATDWYTRLVLTIVGGCLVWLVVQGQREAEAAPRSEEGRYRLQVVPIARIAIRLDSATGEAWTAMFPDLKIWTKIAETPSELLDREEPPAPAPMPGIVIQPPIAPPATTEEPAAPPEAAERPAEDQPSPNPR